MLEYLRGTLGAALVGGALEFLAHQHPLLLTILARLWVLVQHFQPLSKLHGQQIEL